MSCPTGSPLVSRYPTPAICLLVSLAFATPVPASAGEEPEQILVTATRISEDATALPLSWSKVSTEAIELTGHVHVNELMQRVPGVWISRGNGQESLPALRSPVLTGAGSCGAFYIAADNISLRAPGFCNTNQLFEANTEQAGRVEVIRGPASASYGSNAMHGVINVLSAAPTPAETHQLSLEAGPYDYYRARYRYANTRGAQGISLSINGTTDGGYKEDSGFDQQKLTLRHDYRGSSWNLTSVLDYSNLNQETAGFITGYKAYEDEDLKDKNPNPEAYRDARALRLYTRASRAVGDHSTLVVTPYLRDNEMDFMMHFVPWKPVEENGHSSLGLQAALHSDLSHWQWSTGLELEYTDGWLKETQRDAFSPAQPEGVHYDYQVDAINAALFTQARFQAGSDWEFSGGVRYESTRYDYDNRAGDGPACMPGVSGCRFYRPADRRDQFNDASLNVGGSWTFAPQQLAYLRFARGFRAPQATELYRLQSGQRVADLEAEELDNIELGLRGNLTENIGYTLAAYRMRKDEVIFQDADRQNISGARTRHDGLEGSLDYRFADSWYLRLNATIARHRYDSRINLLGSSGNIKGNDIDTAPRHLGSGRLGWNFSAGGTAELELIYLGSHYLEPDNEFRYTGHTLLNLRIMTALGDRWWGSLRVTNLSDEDYAERADFGFGSYRYFVGQPRGAYLEIGYRFAG